MKILKLIALYLFVGTLHVQTFAQTNRDLAAWSALELGYKVGDNWKLGFETQLRLKENLSTVDEYFGELTVRRKLFKGFSTRLGLRYIRRNDTNGAIQGFDNRFRYHVDARYKHKVGDFRMGYRLRYQNRNELGLSKDEGDFNVKRIRFKTGLEYKINDWKLDPKVAFELFSRFQENTEKKVDKFRVTIGTTYNLKNAGDIEAFWRLERSIGETTPDYLYIIGVSYKYTLN